VVAISAGVAHGVALTDQGRILAWGQNSFGQLAVPVTPAGSRVAAVSAGAYHTLALTDRGQLLAWGWNRNGQAAVPAPVTEQLGSVHRVAAIAAGGYHNLLLLGAAVEAPAEGAGQGAPDPTVASPTPAPAGSPVPEAPVRPMVSFVTSPLPAGAVAERSDHGPVQR
jgi:hypothetical protein